MYLKHIALDRSFENRGGPLGPLATHRGLDLDSSLDSNPYAPLEDRNISLYNLYQHNFIKLFSDTKSRHPFIAAKQTECLLTDTSAIACPAPAWVFWCWDQM